MDPADWGLQLLADALAGLRPASPPPSPLVRRLMRAATGYYLRRAAVLALLLASTITPLVWYLDRRQQSAQRTAVEILLTDAEWEYACRAGTTTCRFFGETTWYMDSYAWSYDNGQETAHPVASLMPNRFGLFDMLGNVSEWCHDEVNRRHRIGAGIPPGCTEMSSPRTGGRRCV